jgi:hypothetical protein
VSHIYYTYGLLDPSEPYEDLPGTPFYVGKGQKNRANVHLLANRRHHNKLLAEKVASLRARNIEPIVYMFGAMLSERQALKLEEELITKYGRIDCHPNGILVNIRQGGCGSVDKVRVQHPAPTVYDVSFADWWQTCCGAALTPPEVHRPPTVLRTTPAPHPLKGKAKSEAHKAALSKARTGFRDSPETCAKKKASHTGLKHSEAHKKAIGDGNRGRIIPEEAKSHLSKVNSHHFILTSPDGTIHEVDHLLTWAPANNLSYQCLLKVANGIKEDWLGWKCERVRSAVKLCA